VPHDGYQHSLIRALGLLGDSEMRVIICVEFDGIDPDSEKADEIVNEITESCEHMQIGFNASGCFVMDALGDIK